MENCNRVIKFRAWDKRLKAWLFNGEPFYPFGEVMTFDLIDQYCLESKDKTKGETSLERKNDIEIVEFTGLHDKNGKEIYEGDIDKGSRVVKFGEFSYLNGEDHYSRDVYEDGYGYYTEDKYLRQYKINENSLEIIGNIYENPELLEVSRNDSL